MWASEGAPTPANGMQNGRGGEGFDHGALSPTVESHDQVTAGAGDGSVMPEMALGPASELFGDPDDVLMHYGSEPAGNPTSVPATSNGVNCPDDAARQEAGERRFAGAEATTTACSAQLPSDHGYGDVEDLLSRAHGHAERLRVHAEAARAEAESLRAEAAALRRAALDEAAAARSRAEALSVEVHARAEEIHSAMKGQADAARAEVEQLGKEVASLRRLLQTEIDATRADTHALRAEVQSLWAETHNLAAEFRLFSDRAAAAVQEEVAAVAREGEAGSRPPHGPAHGEHADVSGRVEMAKSATELSPSPGEPETDSDPGPHPTQPQIDVRELLREIWDVAHTEATWSPDRRFHGGPAQWADDEPPNEADEAPPYADPLSSDPQTPRTSQPLIGSGGWHASAAATPGGTGEAKPGGAEMPPPLDSRRRGLRRRR